ncbi:uncharacterized protein LOC123443776 [Hordeum vulgare subsp. vulgare]|uniref:Predicted protein n=1 Tax=Hordeum vulgare subsp. vulgare TaxID=112509 RepID=F2EEI9_HORVV|nr:uncharacterized protein LOC123443776 [Hordeum vulgare subsp. vulgare]BAK05761.1 predicted protein [Hordeum vulgare subsp. vulgare]
MASAGVPRRRYQGCSAMDADPRDHPRCSSLSWQAPPQTSSLVGQDAATSSAASLLLPQEQPCSGRPWSSESRRIDLCKAPPPPTLSGSAT